MRFGLLNSVTEMGPVGPVALSYSATITLTVTEGNTFTLTSTGNCTINASGTQVTGQEITVLILNDGSLPRTVTFGTGFKAAATVIGTVNKMAALKFVSDGTNLYELCRTLGL